MSFWGRNEPPPEGLRQGDNLRRLPNAGPESQQGAAGTVQRVWRGHASRASALLVKHARYLPSGLEAQRQLVLNIARSYVGKLHWGNHEACGGSYISHNGVLVECSPAKQEDYGYSSKQRKEFEELYRNGRLTRSDSPSGLTREEIRRLPGMYGRTSEGPPQDVVVRKSGMFFPSPFSTWAESESPLHRAIAARELADDDPHGAMNCWAFIQWCFYQARLLSGRLVRHQWYRGHVDQQILPSQLNRLGETEPKPADLLVIRQGENGAVFHVCFFARRARWLCPRPSGPHWVIELSGSSAGGRVHYGPLRNPFPGSEVMVADFGHVVERLRRRQAK